MARVDPVATNIPGVFVRKGKKNDTYYIRYRDEHGKSKNQSVGHITKYEAKKLLDEKKKNKKERLNDPEAHFATRIKAIKFSDLASFYFDYKTKKADEEENTDIKDKQHKTMQNVKRETSLYNNFWKDSDIDRSKFSLVQEKHVIEFLSKQLHHNYAPQSCYNALALARSMFKLGIEEKLLVRSTINPFVFLHEADRKRFQKPKNANRKLFLTEPQAREFVEYIKDNVIHKHLCIAMTSLLTGARPNSVLTLKIEDLNFNSSLIRLYDYKRKMFYNAPFPLKLQKLMQKHTSKRKKDEYVFFNENPLVYLKSYPKSIKRAMNFLFNNDKDESEERVVPYTLRHTFANLLLHVRKIPIDQVSRALNHSSVTTTEKHYITRSDQELKEEISDFEDMFLD